jgi:hypothetical protein
MVKISDERIINDEIIVVENKAKLECLAIDQKAQGDENRPSEKIICHSV